MPANYTNHSAQKGGTLIEALIGLLLMSILLLGLSSVLARTLVSQRYMNTQNIVLLEIREALWQEGLLGVCANNISSVAIASQQLTMAAPACSSPAISNVGIAGELETLPAGSVPATSIAWSSNGNEQNGTLIGGDGVMSISY